MKKKPLIRDTIKTPPAKPAASTVRAEKKPSAFQVRRPLLWLSLAALVVYFPTVSYGLTDLDDGIFINSFHEYNEDIGNLITSFQRGLFDAVKDTYYRPVFFDVMILNYQLSDHGQNLALYHVINIIFHIVSVSLLFRLLTRLQVKPLHAFLLTLLFAVHPVLSQAVAWIPGRNDTMLAICFLSFLIASIDYASSGKWRFLATSALFLLLAYFTKETAVAAAPVAFILIVFVLQHNWLGRRSLFLYGTWLACFLTWLTARAMSTAKAETPAPATMAHDFVHKLPLFIQYIGKILLPFNLSVYPTLEDGVYYSGIIAIVLLAVGVILNNGRKINIILSGLAVFVMLLLPILIVPDFLNLQAFEHRLYLPVTGILLVLSQTVALQNKLKDIVLFSGGIVVAAFFAVLNFIHQPAFSSPLAFWSQAARSSPHSAYANMMLAARIGDEQKSDSLFLKAYALNPNERMLNFIYGFMLQSKDSVLASEKYFLTEKKNSGYYPCDFYLARVEMEKKNLPAAIIYLEAFLKKEPKHPLANNNLIFLYIDTGQPDKAKALAKQMQQEGLQLSPEAKKELNM